MESLLFQDNQYPILYHKSKNGKIHSWEICTIGANILTRHGTLDGKKQISTQEVTPKNIGKKNATTGNEQAKIEAAAMHLYKVSRKYSETPSKAQEPVLLPMLAKVFEDRLGRDVVFPGYVQRKYDGVRCLARWEGKQIKLLSRNGKTYNCPHIIKELEHLLGKDDVFDGELYLHEVGFQTITSWVKKLRPETQKIEYHVYDIPEFDGSDDWMFETRAARLHEFACRNKDNEYPHIKFVPTYKVNNEQEVRDYQSKFVEDGFEGAIFRNAAGLYLYGYRSNDLLKVKSFNDDEFEIAGFTEGKGKDKETVIWVCKTARGDIFNVRSADTYENRKEYFQHANKYIGSMLSIKYFGLSDEGIPRFPVGIGFKEDR